MSQSILRRGFLRAAGVSLALPTMESRPAKAESANASTPRRRMVCIANMLGFYPPAFWPTESGADYELSQTLSGLAEHKQNMTVISGLDHGVKGGHFAIHAFLSGVRHVDAHSVPEGNQTVDQRAAETVGGQTRFSSLTVGSETGIHGGCQLSWTRSGTRIPPITGPAELFQKLFVGDKASDRQAQRERYQLRESILDVVHQDAKSISPSLAKSDRAKLDEYFTSIREVEQRLDRREAWLSIPKPNPEIEQPANSNMVEDLPLLYELIALALQTDSTRVATLEIGGDFQASQFGYRKGYHALSHHGQVQESIDALIEIESYQVDQFAKFLTRLESFSSSDGTLLDETMVLFGSGMGNANSHTNQNLPLVLAGGGFEHGRHLAFHPKDRNRPPLTNLFVSMLQQFGVQTDRFSTSTGTLPQLQAKSV